MKKVVISVDHQDETGKYWSHSYIQNKTITVNDGETIHDAIVRTVGDIDGCEFAYKGKPQGNVYVDRNGESVPMGYHYRTKHLIADRSADVYRENVPFTTWVRVHGVLSPVEVEEIDV